MKRDTGRDRSSASLTHVAAVVTPPRLTISSLLLGSFVFNGRRFDLYADDDEHAEPFPGAVGMMRLDGRSCLIVEKPAELDNGQRNPADVLTARELQIAALVAHGCPTKQCAHRLGISEWTVQTHLRRTYAKLGVAGRTEMVFRCARLLQSVGL